jgi:hypothetical protein
VIADVEINETALRDYVMGQSEVFLRSFTAEMEAVAKEEAPERTGQLKRMIHADEVRRTGPWTLAGGVSSLARHSAFVHKGTRPHVIRARNAPALVFYWPKVGRTVFFKRVNHPGTKANPFLERAAERTLTADPRVTVGGR